MTTKAFRPLLFLFCVISIFPIGGTPHLLADEPTIALAIHGGAGSAKSKGFAEQNEQAFRDAMRQSLRAGHAILDGGGTSLDAVQAAIAVLEDSPLFNAGKGAVFTDNGRNELDASIMDGKTLKAGAVGGVTTIKNPILAARAVMDHTWHVLLVGPGAEEFAGERGLDLVSPEYFRTERRWKEYLEGRRKNEGAQAHSHAAYFGTVGAVALDREGNVAAGTSTGGLMHKRYGRLGDSPIIGAGTYADNATCAISGTGQGEFFMRHAIAYDISARMKYLGQPLEKAAQSAIQETLTRAKGRGGVIGIDAKGRMVAEFNTPGMVRGFIDADGKVTIAF